MITLLIYNCAASLRQIRSRADAPRYVVMRCQLSYRGRLQPIKEAFETACINAHMDACVRCGCVRREDFFLLKLEESVLVLGHNIALPFAVLECYFYCALSWFSR